MEPKAQLGMLDSDHWFMSSVREDWAASPGSLQFHQLAPRSIPKEDAVLLPKGWEKE